MTSPARTAEADRVETVYFWALNQLANEVLLDAEDLWQDVPKTGQAKTAGWWLKQVIALVMLRRAQARDLAIAYYRLVRALRTGHTITDPARNEEGSVSLERLRDEFEAEVDAIDQEVASHAPADNQTTNPPLTTPQDATGQPSDSQAPDPSDPGPEPAYTDAMYEDDEDILLEEIADLDKLIEEQDRAAEEEASVILDQLGIENMLNKLDQIDQQQAAEEADKQAQEAHEAAGRRQAAAAQRITMNAARGLVYNLADTDKRVIAWARYSRTGTPCGWCAMLISRGAVYKTRKSAGDQDKYHDNCRCIAIPIFFPEQMDSDLFALNRQYKALWDSRIKGKYGGDLALTKWRRIIRDQHKEATSAPAAA